MPQAPPRGARIRASAATIFALLLLCSLALSGRGQTASDGALFGRLVDPAGTPVAGASVSAERDLTAQTRVTTTDSRGEFLLAQMPPGDYTVRVHAGAQTAELRAVTVTLGGTARVELSLRATVETTVDVEAADTTDLEEGAAVTTTAAVIDAQELAELPLDGRQWRSFALLTPEANPDVDEANGLLSFRGLPATQNSSRIDGADADQSFGSVAQGSGTEGGTEAETAPPSSPAAARDFAAGAEEGRHPGADYTFSQEAVREFRVGGQNYSALYGHAAGGVVTTVSRGGGNRRHGTAFSLLRDSAWGAANPFSVATHYAGNGQVTSTTVKPHDLRQQMGGSLGGPLLRDRLFYFAALDGQRRGFPAVSSPESASFFALTAVQRAVLANRGVGTAAVEGALRYLDGLTGTVPRRSDQIVGFGKLEWQMRPAERLGLQWNSVRSNAPAGVRRAPVVNRGISSLGNSQTSVTEALLRWSATPSAHWSAEARAGWSRDLQSEQPQASLPQEPAVGPGGLAPEIAIAPQGFSYGTPAALGRRAYPDERKWELGELLSWARGRHLLQVGAEGSFVHDSIDSLGNAEGTFTYSSGYTGGRAGGLVDWITDFTFSVNSYPNGGCPSIRATVHLFCFRSFTQSFGAQSVAFNTQEWSGFAEDTWRVNDRLTVGAGVRYEYELMPLPQQPNFPLDAIFGSRGATGIFPEDRNNFGPRVSLAWEPLGRRRGVVRVGYGVYFGRLAGATIRRALIDTVETGSATRVRITPSTITGCPQVANQGFGFPCAFLSAPPSAVAATSSATVFARRFRTPMVQEASLGLEREAGWGTTVAVSYLLNLARQLPGSTDLNIAPSTSAGVFQLVGGDGRAGVQDGVRFSVPMYTARLSSSYGPVTAITSNSNASYNALVVEARRHSVRGLGLRASWTWSKALDLGGTRGALPRVNGQFDPFQVGYDKGLSSLNYPWKLVATAIWSPTLHVRPESWMARGGNGWTISSIFSAGSGRPYSYDILGGSALTGGHESINGSGGAVYLPTVGRNTLRLPARMNLDLRLSRAFQAGDKLRLRAHAEVFNLPNHVNYSAVVQRAFLMGSPSGGVTPLIFQDATTIAAEGSNDRAFGTLTAASSGSTRERQVQLGLRMEF